MFEQSAQASAVDSFNAIVAAVADELEFAPGIRKPIFIDANEAMSDKLEKKVSPEIFIPSSSINDRLLAL